MQKRPNILFLMADQMQGRVLDAQHPCATPHLDRVASRGTRITRAYTPNAVCSPARASLMTGLLPHNHGVLWVTHVVDDDQGNLRTGHPHWAQRLRTAGYRTGYFGKWHVERGDDPTAFGWEEAPSWREAVRAAEHDWALRRELADPPGYPSTLFYGVTEAPPEERPMGVISARAGEFLERVTGGDEPWCCFVSVPEPHDPFVCGTEAWDALDPDSLPEPANFFASLDGKPGIYGKLAAAFTGFSARERREAMACYYASISEIDTQFGRLIDRAEAAGQLENTIVVVTSDHGELLGAHGLYCKNISAFEEVYHIPMLLAGPGIAEGAERRHRVGLHDLGPTLLDLTGLEPIPTTDSRSFASVLRGEADEADFEEGYAEYHGGRYLLTQRILWQGDWKFVFNGFDRDELYNLAEDPMELDNRADDPGCRERRDAMMRRVWEKLHETGDRSMERSPYFGLRAAVVGPKG